MLQLGWFREAAIELTTIYRRSVRIQQTVWKDKKQVGFLHTNNIGPSSGHFVRRSTRGAAGRKTFPAPNAQVNYAQHFNAVDRNDCDSSDYTTSLRTDRWYLSIFFWLFDRVVHQTFVTTVYCASSDVGASGWKTYCKKDGRGKFQKDLGRELMNYAIGKAWKFLDEAIEYYTM